MSYFDKENAPTFGHFDYGIIFYQLPTIIQQSHINGTFGKINAIYFPKYKYRPHNGNSGNPASHSRR